MHTMMTSDLQPSCDNTLNGAEIRLLNWNIQKLIRRNSLQDLQRFAEGVDLALIQEARYEQRFLQSLKLQGHSFVEGYSGRGRRTGVMTFARVEPHIRHKLLTLEPFLRTPKATSLSQYRLQGLHEFLLVINLHAVNFSLGLDAYHSQLKPVASRVQAHRGPVIVAGDFNAWSQQRQRMLKHMADYLGLDELDFEIDERKQVFGKPLDYIFTRDMDTLSAKTWKVSSSDHNPMLANLRVRQIFG